MKTRIASSPPCGGYTRHSTRVMQSGRLTQQAHHGRHTAGQRPEGGQAARGWGRRRTAEAMTSEP